MTEKLGGPAIHPGEILSDELTEIRVTASDLARAIERGQVLYWHISACSRIDFQHDAAIQDLIPVPVHDACLMTAG